VGTRTERVRHGKEKKGVVASGMCAPVAGTERPPPCIYLIKRDGARLGLVLVLTTAHPLSSSARIGAERPCCVCVCAGLSLSLSLCLS
jgi:hypothetical protein